MFGNTPEKITVHLATDHAGLSHKEELKRSLEEGGFVVVDHGAHEFDNLDDFNDYVAKAAKAVAEEPDKVKAVIFGGSGQGEAMMANRFKGVRAAVYYGGNEDIVRLSREHNDANTLSIGARFVGAEEAIRVVKDWLSVDANAEEKYARRIKKLDELS